MSRPTAWLVAGSVLVAVGAGGCTGRDPAPPGPSASGSASASGSGSNRRPTPLTTDPLTGGRPSRREVFAVKIENTAAARPQIGLDAADIVVVEEVEGRLTRLIGVYHSRFPRRVGPVRSARNTDVRLLPAFGNPGLVYSGANRLVQRQLDGASVVPIERSDRDRSRPAPHNVMVDLHALADQHRVGRARDIGWRFSTQPGPWATAREAKRVTARVGGDTMRFDATDGRYTVRWNGRTYRAGDDVVRTDNVVVMSVRNRKDRRTTSTSSVVSETVGSGRVSVYRGGRRIDGTWRRDEVADPLVLTADGADITLAPGRTWLVLQG